MAKGDSTGIAQQGAQLDPNRFNRFGNPNNPVYGGQAPPMGGGGIAGPPPGIMEMLMQMLMGQSKSGSPMNNAVQGAGQIRQGINRLKGNAPTTGRGMGNQKPEMNKNQPKMPMPQSRMPQPEMMPGGGQFMLPAPRQQDMGIGQQYFAQNPSIQPNMGGDNQFLQNPQFLQQLMGGNAGSMRRFV